MDRSIGSKEDDFDVGLGCRVDLVAMMTDSSVKTIRIALKFGTCRITIICKRYRSTNADADAPGAIRIVVNSRRHSLSNHAGL